jgi:hypothetical protein
MAPRPARREGRRRRKGGGTGVVGGRAGEPHAGRGGRAVARRPEMWRTSGDDRGVEIPCSSAGALGRREGRQGGRNEVGGGRG